MSQQMVLEGIRVLDFGRFIAGPYCAAMLADYGADVIRIERVEGGEDRYIPALTPSGEGGQFLQMNRNKRCLTLDVASVEGRDVVRRLIATADVVVANFPPATLAKLGLDFATIAAINPRCILTIATAYGPNGPYSDRVGFDSVGQAMSGSMYMSGRDGIPARAAVNYIDFTTGHALAMGTLAALIARGKTGRGQVVEGALLRSGMVLANGLLIEQALTGRNRVPLGNRGQTAAPVDAYQTTDGWLVVQVVGQSMFERWATLVGRADLMDDERMRTDEGRGDHGAEVSGIMSDWCKTQSLEQALERLNAAKIPCGPVYDLQQALDDPHVRASGLLSEVSFPGLTKGYPLAPHPVTLSENGPSTPVRAPQLGEHTDAILGELGFDRVAIEALRRAGRI